MSASAPVQALHVEERLRRSPLVVLLDVDGTLAPIVSRPEDATVPEATRRVIAALTSLPGVHVALISGRAAADARRMIAVADVWTIGNHGMEIIDPRGVVSIDDDAAAHRPRVSEAAQRLSSLLGSIPGVLVEDKVWTLSVHYRRADPSVVPRVRDAVHAVGTSGLRVTEGKMILEVRPPVTVDKGTAAVEFVRRVAGQSRCGVLCIGDDRTDEDAFRALRSAVPDAVTVRVTGANDDAHLETSAELSLPDVDSVRVFLEQLLALRAKS
jgi:trehalose-phosphatase